MSSIQKRLKEKIWEFDTKCAVCKNLFESGTKMHRYFAPTGENRWRVCAVCEDCKDKILLEETEIHKAPIAEPYSKGSNKMVCPDCLGLLSFKDKPEKCPWCGQALDWVGIG